MAIVLSEHRPPEEAEAVTPLDKSQCITSVDIGEDETSKMYFDEELVQSHKMCSGEDDTPSGTRTPTSDDGSAYLSSEDLASTYSGCGSWPGTSTVSHQAMGQYFVPCMLTPIGPPTSSCMFGAGLIPEGGMMTVPADQLGHFPMVQVDENGVACSAVPSEGAGATEDTSSSSPVATPEGGQVMWYFMAVPNTEGSPDGTPQSDGSKGGEIDPWNFLCEQYQQAEYQQAAGMCYFDGCNYVFPDGSVVPPSMMGDDAFCGWDGALNQFSGAGRLSHLNVPKVQDFRSMFEMEQQESQQEVTTLMIRNIPNRYTRKMLMDELDQLGFAGQYDFIYVPMDKSTHWNVGYAFVNFTTPASAQRCIEQLSDYRFRRFRRASGKVTQVSAAHIQGLHKNLEHYSRTAVQSARIQSHRPLVVRTRQGGEVQSHNDGAPCWKSSETGRWCDWSDAPEGEPIVIPCGPPASCTRKSA